ncbi:UDP-3-O-(3-hydroxymyristoyl)glucosamine N-acyltransferase, partial [PVC group bacterium]|nr:UDP-3-O-(3-hydroxymyristoyl)glucosamine N-acyltransferase [PVC group bacterium]
MILGKEEKEVSCSQLIVENPYYAFACILHLFDDRPKPKPGIHPKAHMGNNVRTGRDVSIGPLAVVEDGAELGDRVTIYPGVYIGPRARIGDDTILYANVTVADGVRIGKRVIVHSGTVIGSDGFGFASHEGRHYKIPQVGSVVVEDDVEIGANVAIDRGALGDTRIGRGTKIDNLVQIAHNVRIGENGLLISQVGISGSVEIGKNVTLAGQTGVAGHLKIGDKVIAGGRAGIAKDVSPGQVVSGAPAIPHRQWLESVTLF